MADPFDYPMPQAIADCAEELADAIMERYDARRTTKRRRELERYLTDGLVGVASVADAQYARDLNVPRAPWERAA